HVLIPSQTSRNHDMHLGDTVDIALNDRTVPFTVAGVVQAPILDMAVSAFQAQSYMQFAAANVVIGHNDDLRDKFNLDVASMVLFDMSFDDVNPPNAFLGETVPTLDASPGLVWDEWMAALPFDLNLSNDELAGLADWRAAGFDTPCPGSLQPVWLRINRALKRATWNWSSQPPDERWLMFAERLFLLSMADDLDRPAAKTGSLRRLRDNAEKYIRRACEAFTWMPTIVLFVAAIGIGNLMMVNIQIRARQIAVLRAVGAVKSQILRLVLAEAISLALIGSVCGIALGVHMGYTDNRLTSSLAGFDTITVVPFGKLAMAVGLTVSICLLAGLIPARRAARNDIVGAMQSF
ncbi:MAG: ABC transporter permease, partial [Phycisphaerae bacterium]